MSSQTLSNALQPYSEHCFILITTLPILIKDLEACSKMANQISLMTYLQQGFQRHPMLDEG